MDLRTHVGAQRPSRTGFPVSVNEHVPRVVVCEPVKVRLLGALVLRHQKILKKCGRHLPPALVTVPLGVVPEDAHAEGLPSTRMSGTVRTNVALPWAEWPLLSAAVTVKV